MKTTTTQLAEMKLVGIATRTSNAAEMNPITAKIAVQIQKYLQQQLSSKIIQRKKPGTTYCVYTDYQSDYNGEYTYFVGEEVESFENLPEGFVQLTIPKQTYVKFTNGPGVMPFVCIQVWQKIWQMGDSGLGGPREYLADFEVYDERAMDPKNAVLDVYLGIKQ
jgi:predicted transcriptional regulator YdeE